MRTDEGARHAPREFGVHFCKATAKQRLPCWRWKRADDGAAQAVTIDGSTVTFPSPGPRTVKRLRCASQDAAEVLGGQIAEELAGAVPGAKRRRRYKFEPAKA